ncbi:MAG: hypothetical protein R6V49_06055 [Bacteroidales bacterium]
MRTFSNLASGMAAILLMLIFSCAPAYVPNVVTTPMLGQQGEVVATFNTGISGFDPQFAYAITDEIGVIANGSFRDYTSDSTNNYHRHLFGEVGAGYFTKLGNAGRFEVYGGGGGGLLQAEFDNQIFVSFADVRYYRGFIQPSIGLVTDVAELSFSSRFVFLTLQQDGVRRASPFIEPAITAKLGYKYVKGTMQLGLSLPMKEQLDFFYQPFIFSMGLQIRIVPRQL